MISKIVARLFLAVFGCCLLSGCPSKFHLLLFNNTDDTITIYLRTSDPTPLVVLAGISGDITGVSTDDFIIEHNGQLLHYRFPRAYTFPSASVPSGYERKVRRIGRSFYFQLASDNRIYILPERDPLQERSHPPQPAGFPLTPH